MIRIYCNENDEPHFTRCLNGDGTNKHCDAVDNNCDLCPYYDCNVQFVHRESNIISIETDEDYESPTCLYNTSYNFRACGMVDRKKNEDCDDCRFWYENIEVINYKEETK